MTGSAEAVKFELVAEPHKRKTRPMRSAKDRRALKRKRYEVQMWLRQYKAGHPCVCGENDPACLDFHHVSDVKNKELSDARTMSQILKELPYCIILCANCHRKAHKREDYHNKQLNFL